MTKISVIVPVYRININFFRICLDSLLMQTYKNIEIILIDDGSQDECSEMCDDYAGNDSRIVVVHQENKGVSAARNLGILISRGEWILFVDGDDFVEPDMCELALNYAIRNDSDIMMFSNYVHQNGEIYEHSFFEENISKFTVGQIEEFQLRTMILHYPKSSYKPKYMLIGHTFGKLIKKDYITKNKIYFEPELRLQQDCIFYLHLTEGLGTMSYLDKPLYHYRVYNTSNCKKLRKDIDLLYGKVRLACLNFIKKYNKPEIYYNAFYAKCIQDISQSIKNDFFNINSGEHISQRVKRLKIFLQKEPFKTAIEKVDKDYLTRLKRRNLFYYRHGLLWLLWLDWKIYDKKKR